VATSCKVKVSVDFSMTFTSSTTNSTTVENKQFHGLLEEVRQTISGKIGNGYETQHHMVTFNSLASGSVIIKGSMGVPPNMSANTIYSGTQNIMGGRTVIGPFSMVGASYTASGFTPTNDESNLTLILALAIPIGLVIIIITVIVCRYRNRNNEETEHSPGYERKETQI